MNERIHRVLDGELPREALSAAERAELESFEAVLAESEQLFAVAAPDLTSGVMERIETPGRAEGASVLTRALDWLWRPRTVALTLRPAPALAGAALLAAVIALPLAMGDRPGAGPDAVPLAGEIPEPRVYVHFRLDAPEASSVELAGDFTDWEPAHELYESRPGVWSVVIPLDPGVHDYAFVVDGERWVPDPLGVSVDDGFGGTNSRLSVLPPEGARTS